MSNEKATNKTWRETVLWLVANGSSEEEVVEHVLNEYADNFKNVDSGRRTIIRFMHSEGAKLPQSETFNDAVEKMKTNMQQQEERIREREAIRKKAATDIIIEGVLDAIKTRRYYQPRRFETPHNTNYSEETIVLMLSDLQAGTYISKEATGGLNEYNWDILEKQFDLLADTIEEIVIRHKRVAPIENLHVHLIGDIVEGWDIFRGQTQNIDKDIGEQLLGCVDLLVNFLDRMRTLFKSIHVVGVPGNHGRIGKRGENPHYVNYDYIVYKFVERELRDFPEFTWQITKSWWQIDTIYGYRFLMFHGDDIKSWQGIPYYGIDRASKNYKELLERMHLNYDYMEIGHFHMPAELSGVTVEKFVNGCWPGGSIYAMKGLATASEPVQKLFAVHPKHGVTYRYPIRLDVFKANEEIDESQ